VDSNSTTRQRGRLLRDLAYVPAFVAAIILAYVFHSVETSEQLKFEQEVRENTFDEADKSRLQLGLHLNTHAMLVRGMVASFAANPDMSREQFDDLAKALLEQGPLLRYVGVAPGMIISMIYPADGKEVLGLDMRGANGLAPNEIQAIANEGMNLKGPFKLVVGDRAVAIRVPVFEYQDPGNVMLWGVVSATLDLEELLEQSGLGAGDATIRTALVIGKSDGELFFGDASILDENPVLLDMQLPGLEWTLAAVPLDGWPTPQALVYLRSGFVVQSLLVLIPLIISAQLYRENFDHLETLKGRETELRAIWRRYRLALDASDVGVWDFDFETGRLRADRRLRELFGGKEELPHGDLSAWMANVPEPERHVLIKGLYDAQAKGSEHRATFPVVRGDGETRYLRMIAAPARSRAGSINEKDRPRGQVIGLCWDVTSDIQREQGLERARAELMRRNSALEAAHARIEEAALTDPLTGLANRRCFERMRQDRAGLDKPLDGVDALLLLDLDGFKEVNDRLGHPSGDQLLIRVGEVLRQFADKGDLVARIGGDEFAVLLQGQHRSAADITALARKIIKEIRKASREIGAGNSSGCSVGLSRPGSGGQCMAELLASADYALYRAKQQKSSKLAEYTPTLHRQKNQRAQRARELRAAVLTRQFEVCYQPRYAMKDMAVTRLEALVRWRHPEMGLLTPSEFMQDLIDMGLSVRIDRYVMEQVIEDLAAWEQGGLGVRSVSVNISAQRLADDSLLSDLSQLGPAREKLVLELLEAIDFASDDGLLMENIRRLRKMGIALEVDDFGTGHSSPLNMLRLRPDGIKIARELIAPVVQSEESRKMVAALVALGKSLGIRVTAEGVETQERVEVLSYMGLDELQGFALGKPMSFVQVAQDPAVIDAFSTRTITAS